MSTGGTKPKGSKHWTSRLETAKVWIFLAQILVVILIVIMGIMDDLESIEEGYVDLPGIMVPLALLVVALGFEGLLVFVLLCLFRPRVPDRIRDHRTAARAALGTAIASIVVFVVLVAPPMTALAQDLAGRDYTAHDDVYEQTLSTRDYLNVTEPKEVRLVPTGGERFDVELYLGGSVSDGVLLASERNLTLYVHGFEADDTSDYVVLARGNGTTGALDWTMTMERVLRPRLLAGVAYPFLLLGIVNAAWYSVVRQRAAKLEATYVVDQKRQLRGKFKVEEAFLIYEDGRLIAHNSRRLKPERDKDITTGMLTAVQAFVTDTLMDEEKGTLDQLKYGNLSILVEPQGKVNLAIIISGEETPVLRQGMRNIVAYINKRYSLFLEDWDGDIGRFRDVKRYIGHLVSTGAEEKVVPDEVFLIHRDGRLIAHQTSRLEPSIDNALLQQWVAECLGAVRGAMEDPSIPIIQGARVADTPVTFEYNSYLCLAHMGTTGGTEARREHMSDILGDIDTKFRDALYAWDGQTTELTEIKVMLEAVFTPPEED
jgi:hypothetical protein